MFMKIFISISMHKSTLEWVVQIWPLALL